MEGQRKKFFGHPISFGLIGVITAAMLLMIACSGDGGGGGSGGVTPAPTPATPVTTLSGTAAAGAPIKGKAHLRDATGKMLSQVIDDDGEFLFDINGLTAPYLLWAEGIANTKEAFFYSMANEGGRANVTPATHCIMAMALGQNPASYYRDNPSAATPDAAKVDEAKEKLSTLFSRLYESRGVPAGFDLMNGQFAADGTGFDGIMDVVEMMADEEFVNIVDRGSNTTLLKQEVATGSVVAEETPEKVNELCLASVDVLDAAEQILTTLSNQFVTTRPTYDQLLAVMQPLMSDEFRDNGRGREGMMTNMANGAPIGFSFENIALYRKMKSHTFGDVAPWSINELPSGYAEGVWCTYTYRNGNQVSPAIAAFVRETADGPWKWHGDQNPFRTGGVVDAESAFWRQPARLRIYSGLRFRTEDTNNLARDQYGIIQFVVFNDALPTWYSSYSGNTYKGIVLSKDADPSVFYNITSTGQTWGGRYFEKDGLDVNAITDNEFVFVGFDSSNQSQHVWIDLLEKKPVKEAVLWRDALDRASSDEYSSYFSELLSIWGEAPEVYMPEASMDSAAAPLQWELSPLGDHVDYAEVGFRDSANFRYVKGVSNPAINDALLSLTDWVSTTIDISSLGLTWPPVSGWSYLQTRDEFLRRYGTETDFTVGNVPQPEFSISSYYLGYRTYSDSAKNGFRGYVEFLDLGLPIIETDIQTIELINADTSASIPLENVSFDTQIAYFGSWDNANNRLYSAFEPIYWSSFGGDFASLSDIPDGNYFFKSTTQNQQTINSAAFSYGGKEELPVVDSATMKSEWVNEDLKLSWQVPTASFTQIRLWIGDDEAGITKFLIGLSLPTTLQEVTIPKRVIDNAKILNPVTSGKWRIDLRANDPSSNNRYAQSISDWVEIAGWK